MKTVILILLLSPAPAAAQTPPSFVTAPDPVVSIGVVEGEEPYLLDGVSNALRRADGSIVIGNCGSEEVRYFDAQGRHVRTVGRSGAGPGELTLLRRIFEAGGDTIATFDGLPPHRVSLFAGSRFVRMFRVPPGVHAIGRMRDGRFVGRRVGSTNRDVPGLHVREVTLYRIGTDGAITDSVGGMAGPESRVLENGRSTVPRMHRVGVTAVLPDRIVFGDQRAASYIEYGPDLEPVRTVPTITAPQPMTDAVRRAWEEVSGERGGADAPNRLFPAGGVLPVYGEEYADSTPAYRDIVAGADGRVWLQDPYMPDAYPLVWTAYDSGRAVARAEVPARFFPTQFGGDWVLGVHFDDLGVQRVRLLRLVPGSLSGRRLTPREAQPPDVPRCGPWSSR